MTKTFRKPSDIGMLSVGEFVSSNITRIVQGISGLFIGVCSLLILILAPVIYPICYLYQNFYGYSKFIASIKEDRERYIRNFNRNAQ